MPSSVADPTKQSNQLPLKLLRYALDPGCSPGEAVNAATRFIQTARRQQVTFDVLASALAIVPKSAPPARPEACEIAIPFGKRKGQSLYEIVTRDPAYARWLCDEANIDGWLRTSLEIVFDYVTTRGAAA